ncbi:MAG: hypothetical protein QM479_08855 [Pseudomonadota bacterium]
MSSEIFKLNRPFLSARTITQSVLQAGFCLNMYHAELARILQLQCNDIGLISSAQYVLQPGSRAYQQAILFIMLYQALFNKFNGNAIAMYRWLHHQPKNLSNSPHLLIVDENKIMQVVDYLSVNF